MLTIAQNLPYTSLASANSEASDWRPTANKAHTAFSLRGFFCADSLLLYGWTVWGVLGLADFPYCSVRQPIQSAHPNWRCGRQVL